MRAIRFHSTLKKLTAITLCYFYATTAYAQNGEMADALRASGKIYVVVGVVLLIFIGVVVYLIRMDRKISKLESFYKEDKTEDQ